MIRFASDYCEGAHPKVLDKLIKTNFEQTSTYGEDHYCKEAEKLIKSKCQREDISVHFLVGGTQTNLIFISSSLRPHQGVISAKTGHIAVHETGAIEATGHKVLEVSEIDGKITAKQVMDVYLEHKNDVNHEHAVQPKLVYISNPTEFGTIYSYDELKSLYETCKECGFYLYMDGARLGYGLYARDNDLDLPAISKFCDAFYIGGTKMGALFGEALVITNSKLNEDFRYIMKQKGALLAKGRLLGLQFIALFEDGLYEEISKEANRLAGLIKDACSKKGYSFLTKTSTNQQFPIMPDDHLKKLDEKYCYSFWQRIDETHSAIRFCTSWATKEEDVISLIRDIESL